MHSTMGSHGEPGFAPNSSVSAGNIRGQAWHEGPTGGARSEMAGGVPFKVWRSDTRRCAYNLVTLWQELHPILPSSKDLYRVAVSVGFPVGAQGKEREA